MAGPKYVAAGQGNSFDYCVRAAAVEDYSNNNYKSPAADRPATRC